MNRYFYEFGQLSQSSLNQEFQEACAEGNLDKVKYLLTSPELEIHADINCLEGEALICACKNNKYQIMDYLLTSPELDHHISIHTQNDLAILIACENGELDMVKYLIEAPHLKDHINVHTKADSAYKGERPFLFALIYNHLEILHYFIYDLDIEKNEEIETYLAINPGPTSDSVENMFKTRDMANQLKTELFTNTSNKTSKVKI